MKRYKSKKRNKTKRRRTHNNRINKRKKAQKKDNKRRKTNMKGGDGDKPKPYPNPNPIPDPIPVPPDPSPKPEPVQNLKLISRFEDIQTQKLYLLSSSDDFLYMYVDRKKIDQPYKKDEIEETINEEQEETTPNICEINMNRFILDYFDGAECDSWFGNPLFYRIDFFNNPNYLCTTSGQWGRGVGPDLFEASFNYINSIYNIYEIDEWPKFLPPPPIRKSNKFSILEECSEEYIKQNKNKMECNQNCCGWPHSGYVCGEVDGLLGSEGKCVEEQTRVLKNPTY